jgi:hypothetical protein
MTRHRVVLAFTERSQSETDLNKMIDHLYKALNEISNISVEKFTLKPGNTPPPSDHLVLCGYDHVTLAHLHLALERGDRITMYDEPGRSLQSELSNIFFRGVDARRLPTSSLAGVEYSWSGRDIVAVTKFDVAKLPSEPKSRSRTRANSPRQVEDGGNASAREGDADAQAGVGDNREDG